MGLGSDSQDQLGLRQFSVRLVSLSSLLFFCDNSLSSHKLTLHFIMMWHYMGKVLYFMGNGFEKLEKRGKRHLRFIPE